MIVSTAAWISLPFPKYLSSSICTKTQRYATFAKTRPKSNTGVYTAETLSAKIAKI